LSRDIFVQDLPLGISSVSQIPSDFEPGLIGTRSEVIAVIKQVAPTVDFADPSWGVLSEPSKFYIEVNLGNDEELSSFAFHVTGGVEAERVIERILQTLNLRALDTGSDTGLFRMALN
jgi:hypothetical protein